MSLKPHPRARIPQTMTAKVAATTTEDQAVPPGERAHPGVRIDGASGSTAVDLAIRMVKPIQRLRARARKISRNTASGEEGQLGQLLGDPHLEGIDGTEGRPDDGCPCAHGHSDNGAVPQAVGENQEDRNQRDDLLLTCSPGRPRWRRGGR